MNNLLLAAIALLWFVRIFKIVRRKRMHAGADSLAENLARILAGQLARGLCGAEAVLCASPQMTDKSTAAVLRAIQVQVKLGKTASSALQSAIAELHAHQVIGQLCWYFELVLDSGASADILSEFADRVAAERHRRGELRSQLLEARTTAVALPIVAAVMASSIVSANHASRSVLGTNIGTTVISAAALVVAIAVAVVLRMTKI